jgi:hypothetical protein
MRHKYLNNKKEEINKDLPQIDKSDEKNKTLIEKDK